jgi:DUF1365 family protein
LRSCIYEGRVRHRRKTPAPHAFEYSLYLAYLDLAELDTVFAKRWLWSTKRPNVSWFRRADYLGDKTVPLDEAVRSLVAERTGVRPEGPIGILTSLRTFGHVFNPVTFYYCWDETGERVETIVAEIENTPWGERHAYVLRRDGESLRFQFKKEFHVSPFMEMGLDYDWRFSSPGERLTIHMTNAREGATFFDATLLLARREATGGTLARVLVAYPFLSVKVVAGIYWNALRLHLKRTPFFAHPRHTRQEELTRGR